MTRIILLDVDGVMVQPAGYRAGLRATLNYFIDPPLEISEGMLAELEKHEITSEWDMAPLFIASYWQELLSRQPVENLPSEPYKAAMEINRRRKVDPPRHVRIPPFSNRLLKDLCQMCQVFSDRGAKNGVGRSEGGGAASVRPSPVWSRPIPKNLTQLTQSLLLLFL